MSVTKEQLEAAAAGLACCANPVIGSNWAYGLVGESGEVPDRVCLRVSDIHCETCGTEYEIDRNQPVEQVQATALALRIAPIRRRPS